MAITTQQVYEAVMEIKGQLVTLGRTVQQNCTDIALLQQHDTNQHTLEDKRDKRDDKRDLAITSLDAAVQAIALENARAVRTGAIVASVITVVGMIAVALLR